MAWLAANPDCNTSYRIFNKCPIRCKEEIMVESGKYTEDLYGKEYAEKIGTGKYVEFWGIPNRTILDEYDKGAEVSISSFGTHLQDITWKDNPVKI